jgi:uncharacterized protein
LVALVLFDPAARGAPRIPAAPPSPSAWVTDGVGVLSAPAREELERRLAAHEKASGQQVVLWIGRDAGGASVEDFAARAFAAWRVGRRGLDDGVVIFALTEERRLRIEVGYGLEDRLTDAVASRIVRELMVPRIQQGDWDGAARAGVEGVLTTLASAPGGDQPPAADSPDSPGWFQIALWVLGGLVLLALFIWQPTLALHVLVTIMGGRWRGGREDGRGFGGFRGGGGRSGGGGASGRW